MSDGDHKIRKQLKRKVNEVFSRRLKNATNKRSKDRSRADGRYPLSYSGLPEDDSCDVDTERNIVDPHSLGKNGLLWLQAQESKEVQSDKLWPTFMRDFHVVRGIPCIDDAVADFRRRATQQDVRGRHIFDMIVKFAYDNKEAGTAIAAMDPTRAASAAWGCLQIMVTAAVNARRLREMTRHDATIINIKECTAIYTQLFLEQEVLSPIDQHEITVLILTLYKNVIRYIMTCWEYITSNKLNHTIRSLQGTDLIHQSFERVREANRELQQRVATTEVKLHVKMTAQTKKVSDKVQQMITPLEKTAHEIQEVKELAFSNKFQEILLWVSDTKEGLRYQELEENRFPGTGAWFTESTKYLNWRSTSTHTALWLSGRMGTGKSHVAAGAVTHLNIFNPGDSALAYYFCDQTSKNGADDLLDPNRILRCLLKQLLRSIGGQAADTISYIFQQRQMDGRVLTSKETKELIIECVNDRTRTYLIVDALDECDVSTRTALLSVLRSIQMEARCHIHLLVSSRAKADADNPTGSLRNFENISMQNEEDLQNYVEIRLNRDFELGILMPELEPHKSEIRRKLIQKANGMFRWATTAMANLERPSMSVTHALQRLNDLPADLKTLYEAIYNRLRENSPDQFALVLKTLSLVMYQRIELPLSAIIEAVSGLAWNPNGDISAHRLLDICADFVDCKTLTGRLCISHTSIYEFLTSRSEFSARHAHGRVVEMCFDSIASSVRIARQQKIKQNTFAAYAINNWVWHVSTTEIPTESQKQIGSSVSLLQKQCGTHTDIVTWLRLSKALCKSIRDLDNTEDASHSIEANSLCVDVGSLDQDKILTNSHPLSKMSDYTKAQKPAPGAMPNAPGISQRSQEEDHVGLPVLVPPVATLPSSGPEISMYDVDNDELLKHNPFYEPGIGNHMNLWPKSSPQASDISALPEHMSQDCFHEQWPTSSWSTYEEPYEVPYTDTWHGLTNSDWQASTTGATQDVPMLQSVSTAPEKRLHRADSLSSLISVGSGSSFGETTLYRAHGGSYTARCSPPAEHDSPPASKPVLASERPVLSHREHEKVKFMNDAYDILWNWSTEEQVQRRRYVGLEKIKSHGTTRLFWRVNSHDLTYCYVSCIAVDRLKAAHISVPDTKKIIEFIFDDNLTDAEKDLIDEKINTFSPFEIHQLTPLAPSLKGFSWESLPFLVENIVAFLCSSSPPATSSKSKSIYRTDKRSKSTGSIPSDLRNGLASVNTDPPNPLFAIAVWNVLYLLDIVETGEAHNWTQRNVLGQTPLVLALQRGSRRTFKTLCKVCPIEAFNARTSSGKTLLHVACEQQNLNAAKLILSQPFSCINARDNSCLSALAIAVQSGNIKMISLLINHDARFSGKNQSELISVWIAVASCFMQESAEDQHIMLEILMVIIQIAPKLLTMSVHGFNLLHVAATYDNVELAHVLLRAGANVNVKAPGTGGRTALHIAANEGYVDTMKKLLFFGARLLISDDDGMTPIHCAKTKDSMLILDPSSHHLQTYDRFGRTPLVSALARGATEVVEFLLDNTPFLTDSIWRWASITRGAQWRWTSQPSEATEHNQVAERNFRVVRDTLILPFNISTPMCRVLCKNGISVGISIDAACPLACRIARAAEAHQNESRRYEREGSIPSTLSRRSSDISLATLSLRPVFELDPDSEQAIRETRIEADESVERLLSRSSDMY